MHHCVQYDFTWDLVGSFIRLLYNLVTLQFYRYVNQKSEDFARVRVAQKHPSCKSSGGLSL